MMVWTVTVGFVPTFCLDLVMAAEAIPTACSCLTTWHSCHSLYSCMREGAIYLVRYLPTPPVDTRTGSTDR